MELSRNQLVCLAACLIPAIGIITVMIQMAFDEIQAHKARRNRSLALLF
jgi:hypothetical protein